MGDKKDNTIRGTTTTEKDYVNNSSLDDINSCFSDRLEVVCAVDISYTYYSDDYGDNMCKKVQVSRNQCDTGFTRETLIAERISARIIIRDLFS